jgi:hypothetical protein
MWGTLADRSITFSWVQRERAIAPRATSARRTLDFVVIGTQKSGTTSLWQHLRRHPQIRLPHDKEAPIFATADGARADAVARLVGSYFRDAPADALLGTVTPQYMMGHQGVSAEQIATRIAQALPDVKLIALLRDPVERAISQYRMSVRRGIERRTFAEAARQLLHPAWLEVAREQPTETNAYVVQGEYGRVLGAYCALVPARRLLVVYTSELEHDAGALLDRVLLHLGLEAGFRPDRLDMCHHRGGTRPRLDEQGERELRELLATEIWPRLGPDSEAALRAFNFFFETWNVIPDDELVELDDATRALLEAHYEQDARRLATLGIAAPWLAGWHAGPLTRTPMRDRVPAT